MKNLADMRRSDREVSDPAEIIDILNRADTIRLGLHADPYPYVVPVSFGFAATDDKIVFYFHGATEGLKHDLLQRNPLVCVETDILHRYSETSTGVTAEYESFIGFGRITRVYDGEACRGLDLLLSHCGFDGYVYDHAVALAGTWVYKIDVTSFSGKKRFLEKPAQLESALSYKYKESS